MLKSDYHNQRSKTMQDLQNACLEYGSFMVINHEMSDRLISRVYEALAKFFDLNEEEKKEYESNDPMDRIRIKKKKKKKNEYLIKFATFYYIKFKIYFIY
ncbi:hypothetical protein CFP56_016710 [Quercus suber]|uniref:Non-haem dioxygenase N-terminal domain-containing protein n=1 Tax=Quercus suber TaxID=58331 RepID=A0AAW0KR47_QUESU